MNTSRRFFSHWQNWFGLFFVIIFIAIAIGAPWISPADPDNPGPIKIVGKEIDLQPRSPNENAPLGTLPTQISVFHSLVWGSRYAIVFGLSVTIIIALLGTVVGTVSAYFGGFTNKLLMRVTDAFLAFPVMAGVVLIQQLISIKLTNLGVVFWRGIAGIVDSTGYWQELPVDLKLTLEVLQIIDPVLIAFVLFSWVPYARIMNTVVMRVKQTEFIQASRALGAGHLRQIFRHVIPNAITPVVVLAARDVGAMVVLQATFNFIGFGNGSPWAMILVAGRDWIYSPGGMFTYWWVFVPATLAIILFGIGWNMVGDGLNDAMNPRTR